MEDDKNPPTKTPSSSDDTKTSATTDNKGEDKGLPAKTEAELQTEAYRKKQSDADKAKGSQDDTNQRIDFLESVVGETLQERMIDDFLKENGETYPDVTAEDLKELVSDPDSFERVAKHLQKKHEDIKQSTLASVREVPDDSMTIDEKKKAKAEISTDDPNRFSRWLHIASKPTRK